jgi:uncharacterized protein (TIGR02453 family)
MQANRRKSPSNNVRITAETFRFFRHLSRNNRKEWMDHNRDRYQSAVVQPLRGLLEELTPAMRKLNASFDMGGRTGANFSRINRDIRFAKDKTPYRTQMYLMFPIQRGKDRKPGELYIGVTEKVVTAGFRVYFDRETKTSTLAARIQQAPKWCAQQKQRMARRCESYWYSMEKGEWTKNNGWPVTLEEWKKLKAWVVRRKMTPAAAVRPEFSQEAVKTFREMLPLLRFVSPS